VPSCHDLEGNEDFAMGWGEKNGRVVDSMLLVSSIIPIAMGIPGVMELLIGAIALSGRTCGRPLTMWLTLDGLVVLIAATLNILVIWRARRTVAQTSNMISQSSSGSERRLRSRCESTEYKEWDERMNEMQKKDHGGTLNKVFMVLPLTCFILGAYWYCATDEDTCDPKLRHVALAFLVWKVVSPLFVYFCIFPCVMCGGLATFVVNSPELIENA